jgi:hypothetical protein
MREKTDPRQVQRILSLSVNENVGSSRVYGHDDWRNECAEQALFILKAVLETCVKSDEQVERQVASSITISTITTPINDDKINWSGGLARLVASKGLQASQDACSTYSSQWLSFYYSPPVFVQEALEIYRCASFW